MLEARLALHEVRPHYIYIIGAGAVFKKMEQAMKHVVQDMIGKTLDIVKTN